MSFNARLERGLLNRLWVIDIPIQYRAPFAQLVLRWSQSSGIEWTIKRLKSLKVDLYRRRAGLPPLTWVRKNRRGDLAGCLGGLFRWADRGDKNFRKVVQTLMCYTVFVHSKPTESQLEKFKTALSCQPPKRWEKLNHFHKVVRGTFGGRTVSRQDEVSLILYRGSPSKRKPTCGLRSIAQDSNILGDAEAIVASGWGSSLVNRYWGLFAPVLKGLNLRPAQASCLPQDGMYPFETLGGRIAFIQEPGGKLRSVASPFILYQLALRHFGNAVYALVRNHLPWDCTHDQSKPVLTLQDHLRKGSTVHSVDLSSATDYFPLEVQLSCMRALFGNIEDIDLFEVISKSKWLSPLGMIRWNRGQPLGLYPSFAVFTATHGLLLWYLNGRRWNKDFFVLGDDVVILNDRLHQAYLDTLIKWGCPYSLEKSLSSTQICEFAGKVITSAVVVPQMKWREVSNNNFVDIARNLGHRSRILLSPKQREVFDLIEHCTAPFGLNFSYKGSTLEAMEQRSLQTFGLRHNRVLDSLVDLREVINRNLYGSDDHFTRQLVSLNPVSQPEVDEIVATFDEKVRQVLSELLPWFCGEIHDPRLYSGVPGGLGLSELPPVQLQPSNWTTLDRYRRLLGL